MPTARTSEGSGRKKPSGGASTFVLNRIRELAAQLAKYKADAQNGLDRRGCHGQPPELFQLHPRLLRHAITAFGADRGMFESNFPPDGASSSYPIVWNAFKRLAANLSADEKAKLFSGTAKRVYRLA